MEALDGGSQSPHLNPCPLQPPCISQPCSAPFFHCCPPASPGLPLWRSLGELTGRTCQQLPVLQWGHRFGACGPWPILIEGSYGNERCLAEVIPACFSPWIRGEQKDLPNFDPAPVTPNVRVSHRLFKLRSLSVKPARDCPARQLPKGEVEEFGYSLLCCHSNYWLHNTWQTLSTNIQWLIVFVFNCTWYSQTQNGLLW